MNSERSVNSEPRSEESDLLQELGCESERDSRGCVRSEVLTAQFG